MTSSAAGPTSAACGVSVGGRASSAVSSSGPLEPCGPLV